MKNFNFLSEMKKRCNVSCVNLFLAESLRSQYLLEILHTLPTVKNSEYVIVDMDNIL